MSTTYGDEVSFIVPGVPVALARKRQNKARNLFFDPPAVVRHKKDVGLCALVIPDRRAWAERPVELECTFFFEPPSSWPKWKREGAIRGSVPHTSRPDGDNLLKLVKDALNGVVWRDDSLVVDSIARKRYDHVPRTLVVIRQVLLL